MTNLLQQGSDWLESKRNQYLSQPVIYSRATSSITVNATLGKTEYEVDDDYGLRVKAEVMDFLILAEELVLDGQKTLPKAGDQIRIPRGDQTTIFEVMALSGQECWRYSDSFGKTLRIHTKQTATE
jgi:hypothetical protein